MKIIEKIGPFGLGFIYGGVPAIFVTVIATHLDELCQLFGNYGGAYVFLGIGAVLMIISIIVIRRISRRIAFIAGTIGWLISFAFAFWWYSFGPGAFGHAKI